MRIASSSFISAVILPHFSKQRSPHAFNHLVWFIFCFLITKSSDYCKPEQKIHLSKASVVISCYASTYCSLKHIQYRRVEEKKKEKNKRQVLDQLCASRPYPGPVITAEVWLHWPNIVDCGFNSLQGGWGSDKVSFPGKWCVSVGAVKIIFKLKGGLWESAGVWAKWIFIIFMTYPQNSLHGGLSLFFKAVFLSTTSFFFAFDY